DVLLHQSAHRRDRHPHEPGCCPCPRTRDGARRRRAAARDGHRARAARLAGRGAAADGMLFGVAPSDPWTLALVTLVMIAVGLIATGVPALRAARVDPLIAIRKET